MSVPTIGSHKSGNAAFSYDPSQTEAFKPLRSAQHVPELSHISAVVIGGGTGAPVSIRTLLSTGAQVSCVVAMADDGGSTGILREQANVTAPGDIRKCIAAMAANPDDPYTKAFRYRFAFADNHTLGNLTLSALEDACGSFPEAIAICERMLNARGHVYPSTLSRVQLLAQTTEGAIIEGQARASHSRCALKRIRLKSASPIVAYDRAIQAILEADMVVLGPGSLFTSIIANLMVPGITDAIEHSKAKTVFVCSLADMQGETRSMRAIDHYRALVEHGLDHKIDYMLTHVPNNYADIELPEGVRLVQSSKEDLAVIERYGTHVMPYDFVDPKYPTWHNPEVLRCAFMEVLQDCHLLHR